MTGEEARRQADALMRNEGFSWIYTASKLCELVDRVSYELDRVHAAIAEEESE